MKPRLRIVSYFSIPTDLAGSMRGWPEFVGGDGYEVHLRSADEEVRLTFHDTEEDPHFLISSSVIGPLLERVAGLVTFSLSAHSDYLMVYRCTEEPIQPPQTTRAFGPRV